MLQFDAETTRLLDLAYQGADLTRRRQASFDALQPNSADTILDIGCGNGLLTVELARAVGSDGKVIGIDPSRNMRESAIDRCREFKWIEIHDGTATHIPVINGSVDKAVSVQVFEYLDDIPKAVREVFRALKPCGRIVIGDIHFDSVVWFSDNPDRMKRMLGAWDHHLVERCVPAILPGILSNTGFVMENVHAFTTIDYVQKPDGLASMMLQLLERYAVENGHFSSDEAREWFVEQYALAHAGRFIFSVTHFVVSARKP